MQARTASPSTAAENAETSMRRRRGPPILAYGLAHGGKTLLWTASDLYFMFYMTEVCRVSPSRTGLAIGLSFLVAAAVDRALGDVLARRLRTAAAVAQMQLLGAAGSAVALVLFALAAFLPVELRFAAAILSLCLLRLAYAVLDVPQNALIALAAADEHERGRLTAARNLAGGLARTLLAASFVPLMYGRAQEVHAQRFLSLVLLLAAFVVIGAFLLSRRLRSSTAFAAAPAAGTQAAAAPLLLGMMFVFAAVTTAFNQIEPYVAARVVDDRRTGIAFMAAIALGQAVSQPLWLARARRAAPSGLLVEAQIVAASSGVLLALLPLTAIANGLAIGLVYGVGTGGVMFALWTGIARTATGAEALARIGRFTAVAKLGQGLAIILAGAWLAQSGAADGTPTVGQMAAVVILGMALLGALAAVGRRRMDNPFLSSNRCHPVPLVHSEKSS